MAALRNQRRLGAQPVSSLAVVSGLLGATPWLLPSVLGLGVGLAAHAAWFVACERFVDTGNAAPTAQPSAPRPTPRRAGPPAAPRATAKPKDFVPVPVLSVFDETPDIRTFRLARPEGFDFLPGQFLTVRLRADGRELVRCYSISSPPAARGYLEISVKRQGVVSNALHACVRAGSLLAVRTPGGAFTYPADDDRPLVLLAGGIGITPLISMLRHAVLNDPGRPVTVIYSAREQSDFAFRDELAVLARRNSQVRVCLAATRGPTRPDVFPGRIDASLLSTAVPDLVHAITLLCGPQAMIDGLTETLTGLGVPRSQIRSERFDAVVAATSRHRERKDAGSPDCPAGTYHLKATRCGKQVPVAAGQTLLEAADEHGLNIPSLCRAGVCGTCRTRVVEGDVDCPADLLDDDDRAQGVVLACIAAVRGDCAIEV